MVYKLLVVVGRIAIHFYCRKIVVNDPSKLKSEGPLIIAANHPNSFLDAIILATLFKSPIYSLARGDAFVGKRVSRFLKTINMLPVYRVSEGVENLEHNYTTFDACQKLFEENKIVLIFSEGGCVNEWHLRPLKKGTARLALTAWQHKVPVKVLPLGINYSSFRKFGKIVHLNFDDIISEDMMQKDLESGRGMNEFNEKLKSRLRPLVHEIRENDSEKLKKYFSPETSSAKEILLFLPAVAGFLLNAPLYYSLDLFIRKRAKDHYDSVMTVLLIVLYPFYILFWVFLVFFLAKTFFAFTLLVIFPLTAFCYLQVKNI